MKLLQDSLLEIIRRTSAEIPEDVHKAIVDSLEREKKGTIAESALYEFVSFDRAGMHTGQYVRFSSQRQFYRTFFRDIHELGRSS